MFLMCIFVADTCETKHGQIGQCYHKTMGTELVHSFFSMTIENKYVIAFRQVYKELYDLHDASAIRTLARCHLCT